MSRDPKSNRSDHNKMNFGITLSNRGVLVGLCTAKDLLLQADAVEASPVMDSVWCGDALFVNRGSMR